MNQQPAQRIAALEESATILMAQKSRELQAQGVQVIDLSLGEPDFHTPAHICEAAKKAIDEGYHHYPPVPGYPDLRKAISEKFARDNQLQYTPEQIVVSTGAKQTLANIMLSILNPGDEVIVPTPYWVSYAAQIQLAEATLVEVSTGIDQDFKITPEQLSAAITPKSRMFLFSTPSNPTGSAYTRDELAALVAVFERHEDIIIVSDEIYEYINFDADHVSIGSFPSIANRTVTVNGMSKAFAMTGWRLGYMGAPLWIAKACNKMQGQFTSGANTIAQRAALAALTSDIAPTLQMKEAFRERRDRLFDALQGIDGLELNKPAGAFYFFPRVSAFFGKSYDGFTVQNADDLSLYLLEKAHVALVTGNAFGAPDYIRFSYANSMDNLLEAARRMRHWLSLLS